MLLIFTSSMLIFSRIFVILLHNLILFLVFINIQKYETPSLVSSAQNIPQVIVAYSYTIRNYRPPNTPVTIILGLVSYQVKIPAMELNQGQEPIYLCRY